MRVIYGKKYIFMRSWLSDFGPLKKVDVSKSAIMNIFKSISVIANRNNNKISEFFVKNATNHIFWQGEGVM